MATSVAECDRIMAAASAGGKVRRAAVLHLIVLRQAHGISWLLQVFMISEQSQYWSPVVRAVELIESGAVGDVVSVRAVYRGAPAVWTKVLDGAGGTGDQVFCYMVLIMALCHGSFDGSNR